MPAVRDQSYDPSRLTLKGVGTEKIPVTESHRSAGNVGVGLVKGLGLKAGAIGASMAHDAHNIVVAGVADQDIYAVAKEIEAHGGGLARAVDGRIVASLPLPIAGLMSPDSPE